MRFLPSFTHIFTDLGCQAMADAIGSITQTFGEHSAIRSGMKELRRVRACIQRSIIPLITSIQSIYVPHVKRLGYVNGPSDKPEDIQLRILAVGIASAVDEPE